MITIKNRFKLIVLGVLLTLGSCSEPESLCEECYQVQRVRVVQDGLPMYINNVYSWMIQYTVKDPCTQEIDNYEVYVNRAYLNDYLTLTEVCDRQWLETSPY